MLLNKLKNVPREANTFPENTYADTKSFNTDANKSKKNLPIIFLKLISIMLMKASNIIMYT